MTCWSEGQKTLTACSRGTGLDPNAEARVKFLRRAKRFGGKESKKRRRSSSEDGSQFKHDQ